LRIVLSNGKMGLMVMKQKIKKLKLPLSKMTGNEKDYTAVLLEDVNSNTKAFWEVLSGTQEDIKDLKEGMENLKDAVENNSIEISELKIESEKTNNRLDAVDSRFDKVDERFNKMDVRFDSIEFKLDDLMKEVYFIKEEIKVLKTALSSKADKEKLEILEFKIVRIERHLKLA